MHYRSVIGSVQCTAASLVQQQQHQRCCKAHRNSNAGYNEQQSSKKYNRGLVSAGSFSSSSVTAAALSQASTSSSSSPEMCVIVDENNNVIGAATRYETVSKRLLGRGSYVLVFNSAGQLFVSQRSKAKDCYPGCLDVTISGVVNQVGGRQLQLWQQHCHNWNSSSGDHKQLSPSLSSIPFPCAFLFNRTSHSITICVTLCSRSWPAPSSTACRLYYVCCMLTT